MLRSKSNVNTWLNILFMRQTQVDGSAAWSDAIFSKTYDSTREELFSAWTDEVQVAEWWGPFGFTNPLCLWNARQGGTIYIEMMAPDGMIFPLKGFFHEVVAPEQLIFVTGAFEDENGNVQVEVLSSVIFTPAMGRTRITVEATVMKSSPSVYCFLNTMHEGWKQSLDKLETFLSNKQLNQ